MRIFVGLSLVALLGACAHPCEEQDVPIAAPLIEAGLVLEGGDACDFGSPREADGLESVAYTKLYHGSDEFWKTAKQYVEHLETQGWQRVACTGGLGQTESSDIQVTECYMKEAQLARLHAYDFNGAIIDLDLMRLR